MKNPTEEHWFKSHWRPSIAYVYIMIICFDFILGPVFWAILQAATGAEVITMWEPLTLVSGGLFHAAIGGILGISAFTRGQEKVERVRREFAGESDSEETEEETG